MRQMNVHQYFVYIVSNSRNNVVYVGVTNSLERRVWQHKNKSIPGFTQKYNCDQLVYYEIFEDIRQLLRERRRSKATRG